MHPRLRRGATARLPDERIKTPPAQHLSDFSKIQLCTLLTSVQPGKSGNSPIGQTHQSPAHITLMADGSQTNTNQDETAQYCADSPSSQGAGTIRTNCVFGHNTVPGTLQRNDMQGCFGRTRIERSACSGGEFFRRKCASIPSGNSSVTRKAASSRSGSTSLTRKVAHPSSGSTGLTPIAGHPSLKSAIFRQKTTF